MGANMREFKKKTYVGRQRKIKPKVKEYIQSNGIYISFRMGKLLTVAEGGLMLGVECGDGQRPGGYFLGWHKNVLHHDLVGGYASNRFDKTHQTLYLILLYFIVYTLYFKKVDIK